MKQQGCSVRVLMWLGFCTVWTGVSLPSVIKLNTAKPIYARKGILMVNQNYGMLDYDIDQIFDLGSLNFDFASYNHDD